MTTAPTRPRFTLYWHPDVFDDQVANEATAANNEPTPPVTPTGGWVLFDNNTDYPGRLADGDPYPHYTLRHNPYDGWSPRIPDELATWAAKVIDKSCYGIGRTHYRVIGWDLHVEPDRAGNPMPTWVPRLEVLTHHLVVYFTTGGVSRHTVPNIADVEGILWRWRNATNNVRVTEDGPPADPIIVMSRSQGQRYIGAHRIEFMDHDISTAPVPAATPA